MKRATTDSAADLLTTDQVMERLLADESLRRAAATCVLPAIRYGKEWRFKKSDLEAWIQRRRAELLQPPLTPC
jgi:excisionase family DNA binding protein